MKPSLKVADVIPLPILDLAPIVEGGDAAQSLRNSLDLGRRAEEWGYNLAVPSKEYCGTNFTVS